jgi:DNA repair exonuclease SbcCD ATPase subunit
LRLINKNINYRDKVYKICDSFLELIKNIEKYVKIKAALPDFEQNIEEKLCELIGFYAWYNQKTLTNPKNGTKTLKNYCTFFSTLLLLKEIFENLALTNKKIEKTKAQLKDCESQLSKSISMTPFMTIENQISQLYEAKTNPKAPVPTPESQRIVDIMRISV